MRRCYLVAYDIRDDKRLRLVHRCLKGYGEPWQYSVFFCVLRDIDRMRLERDLLRIINQSVDQVLILALGNDEEAVQDALTVLGQRLESLHTGHSVLVL